MKGKKVKKDTQRISLYRVRLEKDRDLMKQRRATGIAAPEEIVKVIKPVFDGADREQFVVLYLNMKLHPIGVEIIAIGGSYACNVEIKNVFKGAIVANAVAIAVAHNHPSGNVMPSPGDIIATRKLDAAMETIDVHLQDHIIFGYPDYLSMKDCGLLAHILKPENQVIQTEEAEQYNPKIIKMKTPFGKGQIKSTRLAFYESKRKQHKNKQD